MERKTYNDDETLRVAIRHWLQTIGEAARCVSESFQDAYPAIPWHAMIGMRNRIVHDYLGIDEDVVWQTAKFRVPELIIELEKLLPRDEDPPQLLT